MECRWARQERSDGSRRAGTRALPSPATAATERLNACEAAAGPGSGHEVTAHVDGQTERDEIDGAEAHMERRE